jgi:hypothetical protein
VTPIRQQAGNFRQVSHRPRAGLIDNQIKFGSLTTKLIG